jgi:hypothetical protein
VDETGHIEMNAKEDDIVLHICLKQFREVAKMTIAEILSKAGFKSETDLPMGQRSTLAESLHLPLSQASCQRPSTYRGYKCRQFLNNIKRKIISSFFLEAIFAPKKQL